jgi:hypothetical protein
VELITENLYDDVSFETLQKVKPYITNINGKGPTGKTLLHMACAQTGKEEVVRCLVEECNADVNVISGYVCLLVANY